MTTPPVRTSDTWTAPMKTQQLDDVVRVLNDGVRGYHTAADEMSNSILATQMRNLAHSREQALNELMRVAVDETRMTPDEQTGSLTGALHRGWLKIKATVAGDEAVIEAAKTGEDEARSRLEALLAEDLEGEIEAAVRRALLDIESAVKQLDGMSS